MFRRAYADVPPEELPIHDAVLGRAAEFGELPALVDEERVHVPPHLLAREQERRARDELQLPGQHGAVRALVAHAAAVRELRLRVAAALLRADERVARLGRRDLDERFYRFFAVVAPTLAAELKRVDYVDLRYTNGFAVGWRDGPPENLAAVAAVPDRG